MKRLSDFVINESNVIDVQEDSVNKISQADLKRYLEVTSKFLSPEGKDVVNWLINNPDYTSILARKDAENAMASFVNNGTPKEEELKPIYRLVKKVIKNGRALEIPVFQTKEQFDSIINKKTALDEIVLDLVTEKGRNEVAKRYDPLVWKIVRQFENKSAASVDELYAAGNYGLTVAMNSYGKKGSRTNKDDDRIKGYTFLSYASFIIKSYILEHIKNESHMVRIPVSVQAKTRKEGNKSVISNNISIDTPISKDKDGNTKTIADKIGDYERGGKNLDSEDVDNAWNEIKDALAKTIDPKDLDVLYSHFGLFGHKKLSGKEIMAKHGFKNPSNVNVTISKVFKQISKDRKLWKMFTDIRDLIAECNHDDDIENRDYEPIHLRSANYGDMFDESEE